MFFSVTGKQNLNALNWEQFCPLGNTEQYLETCSVVTAGESGVAGLQWAETQDGPPTEWAETQDGPPQSGPAPGARSADIKKPGLNKRGFVVAHLLAEVIFHVARQ